MHAYAMEFIGTFFWAMAATFTGNPLAIGFMFMTMLYLGYHVTKGYYNPAITAALFWQRQLTLEQKLRLNAAQFAGAFAAQVLFMIITGMPFSPNIAQGSVLWVSCFIEMILTAVLVWSILLARVQNMQNAMGFSVMAGIALLGISTMMGIFNPAIGMSIFVMKFIKEGAADWMYYILPYVIAPGVGGLVGAKAYDWFVKAPKGTNANRGMM
ncbi:MAG TPA: aquaporin [Candidatus Bathyarchaeia archaeon]|nr:aquaporin [Candidatus Bathyarchaeia archaeon]